MGEIINNPILNEKDIPWPIYLDTKIVLDMVSIINDGLSMIKSITTSESSADNNSTNLDAKVGMKNIFSFLSFGASADLDKSDTENRSNSNKKTYDKVYTMVSLFAELKDGLFKSDAIKKINESDDYTVLKPGDFVELKGNMEINPIISLLDSFYNLLKMSEAFNEEEQHNSSHRNRNNKQNEKLTKQIQCLKKIFSGEELLDVICYSDFGVNAVITTKEDYFIDSNKNELAQGTYKVLGKIIQKYDTDQQISLLRNSSLSFMKKNMLNQLINTVNNEDLLQFTNKKIQTEVNGPVLLIKPIAIYL